MIAKQTMPEKVIGTGTTELLKRIGEQNWSQKTKKRNTRKTLILLIFDIIVHISLCVLSQCMGQEEKNGDI